MDNLREPKRPDSSRIRFSKPSTSNRGQDELISDQLKQHLEHLQTSEQDLSASQAMKTCDLAPATSGVKVSKSVAHPQGYLATSGRIQHWLDLNDSAEGNTKARINGTNFASCPATTQEEVPRVPAAKAVIAPLKSAIGDGTLLFLMTGRINHRTNAIVSVL